MKIKRLRNLLFGILLCALVGCNQGKRDDAQTQIDNQSENTNQETLKADTVDEFDFSRYVITKGRLGSIKVGMTIAEAEKQFSGLKKEKTQVAYLGIDGEGVLYVYLLNDVPVFALLPVMDTDKILMIIAIHKDLKTSNGLSANATVEEIVGVYPDMRLMIDQLNQWEVFVDDENNWGFVFTTGEEASIGEYPDWDSYSKPVNTGFSSSWININ